MLVDWKQSIRTGKYVVDYLAWRLGERFSETEQDSLDMAAQVIDLTEWELELRQ